MDQREAFVGFRDAYAARLPAKVERQSDDQFRLMGPSDGLRRLDGPAAGSQVESPGPWHEDRLAEARHLWVVGVEDVPYALEACPYGRGLWSGVIKHTNLTGGAKAHCGGEMWFLTDGRMVVNGASGRYGPRTPDELLALGAAMSRLGYDVGVVAWSEDLDRPPVSAKSEDDLRWFTT